jgi:hypothetical protein
MILPTGCAPAAKWRPAAQQHDEIAPLEIEHCGFPPRDSLARSCPPADEG